MAKFRKKPVVIEAFQMTLERRWDNQEWLNEAWNKEPGEGGMWIDPDAPIAEGRESANELVCGTLEGVHRIDWGDWIIQGVKGEIYPCKPDIFEKSYDMAWEATMTHERWTEVEKNQELKLTAQEIADGWHFCPEWDGLLVNSNDEEGEGAACICS